MGCCNTDKLTAIRAISGDVETADVEACEAIGRAAFIVAIDEMSIVRGMLQEAENIGEERLIRAMSAALTAWESSQ